MLSSVFGANVRTDGHHVKLMTNYWPGPGGSKVENKRTNVSKNYNIEGKNEWVVIFYNIHCQNKQLQTILLLIQRTYVRKNNDIKVKNEWVK